MGIERRKHLVLNKGFGKIFNVPLQIVSQLILLTYSLLKIRKKFKKNLKISRTCFLTEIFGIF